MGVNKIFLSLGTNRGDRHNNLDKALNLLTEKVGKNVLASSVYETPPWGMVDETNFFNRVILLETSLNAARVLDSIVQIEMEMGRIRTQKKYEPRTIDIDILFFNDEIIKQQGLIVPHPLIRERRFILEPLAEIAPEYVHPVFRKTILELLEECPDKSRIEKPELK